MAGWVESCGSHAGGDVSSDPWWRRSVPIKNRLVASYAAAKNVRGVRLSARSAADSDQLQQPLCYLVQLVAVVCFFVAAGCSAVDQEWDGSPCSESGADLLLYLCLSIELKPTHDSDTDHSLQPDARFILTTF